MACFPSRNAMKHGVNLPTLSQHHSTGTTSGTCSSINEYAASQRRRRDPPLGEIIQFENPEVSTAKAKRIHAADEGQRLLHGSRTHAAATIKSGTRISLVALTCQRHHQASQRWTAGPRRQADYVEAHTFIERHRLDDRAALQTILPEHWACWRRLCSQAVCFLLWCAHDGLYHLSPCAGRCDG